MSVEENEKQRRPPGSEIHGLEVRRNSFKIRSETVLIVIFIPIITIHLFAAWEFYNNWRTMISHFDKTDTVRRHERVLNVAKLKFDSYLRDFNKTYYGEEYLRRFENFQASLKDIARLNKLENNTVFGLTKFSDMSKEEFADRMLLKPFAVPPCTNTNKVCPKPEPVFEDFEYQPELDNMYGNDIPRSFDWRSKGVVKPVLNQKRCQGCWAFSIVGVLESMSAIQLKDFRSRSIQELLDCSPDNFGCYNGSVTIALKFICSENLEFVTEEEYPLTLAMDRICKLKRGYSGRRITGYVHTCNMNEDKMVEQIWRQGPLIAAVDSLNWKNYLGGVITRACTRGLSNHVVQIVGYEGYGGPDEETPIPYYIVRNSFGEDFGDKGYVKVAMKHGDLEDVCGIAEQVTAIDVRPLKTTGL